ncbi:efflux RND transporter periplasmic adaptor subunit [Methylobacterium sp. J-048]|uniref:efflux RND transporter periplasmic adaptor subunit n=1 Tax=Methylobacterium sp. J-048 TaxID=2836635 RepID=UPI001FB9C76A|nr:efflux RND transporter periplasmic adaptor subunit [Methylobacterium sp. J-048]MCJ2058512.1 efflux RND transporter periplasmic adaptor subunit [Methylobacterium sp. J-048]
MIDVAPKSLTDFEAIPREGTRTKPGKGRLLAMPLVAMLLGSAGWYGLTQFEGSHAAVAVAGPVPDVTVATPATRDVDVRLTGLGQFSAIDRVELRAQVGGTLTEIHFKDGDIVRKGDLLFVIDPRPYEIKLAQAKAMVETAKARLGLADSQLARSQSLARSQFATQETLDQRVNEQSAARAAIDDAEARVRDAKLDLEYTRVTAPFSGRLGARQVSLGGLIAGSRAAASATTLLATIVSLDPIYLDFDMSEQDWIKFQRSRDQKQPLAKTVTASLSDEAGFDRQGKLDFVDNVMNRSSGTIHARATYANPDLFLSPGQFARVRVALSKPAPALLVPDAAVLPDQSDSVVMTVGDDDVVTPKKVEVGDLRDGLRVIRAGLTPTDRVIVDGIVRARPGTKVSAKLATVAVAPAQN